MIPIFADTFAECKAIGLNVVVTISHSAPYSTDTPQDAVDFTKAWVQDANIDVISPQLYSSGKETAPEFDETGNCKAAGCTWDLYKNSKARFVPSIVDSTQYKAVLKEFDTKFSGNINCDGYISWKQVAPTPATSQAASQFLQ